MGPAEWGIGIGAAGPASRSSTSDQGRGFSISRAAKAALTPFVTPRPDGSRDPGPLTITADVTTTVDLLARWDGHRLKDAATFLDKVAAYNLTTAHESLGIVAREHPVRAAKVLARFREHRLPGAQVLARSLSPQAYAELLVASGDVRILELLKPSGRAAAIDALYERPAPPGKRTGVRPEPDDEMSRDQTTTPTRASSFELAAQADPGRVADTLALLRTTDRKVAVREARKLSPTTLAQVLGAGDNLVLLDLVPKKRVPAVLAELFELTYSERSRHREIGAASASTGGAELGRRGRALKATLTAGKWYDRGRRYRATRLLHALDPEERLALISADDGLGTYAAELVARMRHLDPSATDDRAGRRRFEWGWRTRSPGVIAAQIAPHVVAPWIAVCNTAMMFISQHHVVNHEVKLAFGQNYASGYLAGVALLTALSHAKPGGRPLPGWSVAGIQATVGGLALAFALAQVFGTGS